MMWSAPTQEKKLRKRRGSSPALSDGISVCSSPEKMAPLPPHAAPPVCETNKAGEEEEHRENTKSLIYETKEEL